MADLTNRRWYSGMLTQEDWWAVWIGLFFFFLGLLSVTGVDLVGWIAYPSKWGGTVPLAGALKPLGKAYAGLGPWGSLAVTYAIFTAATVRRLSFSTDNTSASAVHNHRTLFIFRSYHARRCSYHSTLP